MSFCAGDFFHGAAGDGGVGGFVGDGGVGFGALVLVVLLNKEPVGIAVAGAGFHADERPLAVQFGAVEDKFQGAVAKAGVNVGVAGLRLPCALVPDHDGASAVLAFGDDAFEAAVLHGVVFDLNGETLVSDEIAGALGDGPAFEDAVPAEAEVIVQAGGGVLLDDEGLLAGGDCGGGFGAGFAGRLGGHAEVAHRAVAR